MNANVFPVTQKEARQTGVSYSSKQNRESLFPTRLRDLRKEKGVSQQECADTIGVVKSTLGLWENGDTLPDARSLAQMAEYYGVSADYLLGLSDVKSPDVSIQKMCELTGLSEQTVEELIRNNESAEDVDMGLADDVQLEHRRLLDAVNTLVYYQPFLLADIAEYLYFRFEHFETDSKIRINTGGKIHSVGKYGDRSTYAFQVTGEQLADIKLLEIEAALKDLRKGIIDKDDAIDVMHKIW